MLSAAPTAASAATPEAPTYSAIAAGLAIPVHARGSRNSDPIRLARHVLVDAASARMFMMEGERVVDSMRVIVGKPSAATPELRSTLHYATLNPYWNVPTDLARTLIAPRVLAQGETYLREREYEVISGFTKDPRVLSYDDVDWQAVADGDETVYLRRRPSPANSMGQMKFGLADGGGIFLHDTPQKELFEEAERNLSNGCIRLEDAPRFARWLLGRDPALADAGPEQHVALPRPVPITITYLDEGAQMQLAALR